MNMIIGGDCLTILPELDKESVDAVICDPPYGLEFMGKNWDHGIPGVIFWKEIIRVIKPGGYLLAFGGTRTFHRLTCAIEDVGFEIRDCMMWLYGSGFPKSLDVSKAIDKLHGAKREVVGVKPGHEDFANRGNMSSVQSLKGTLGGEGGFARPWMDDPEKVEKYHLLTAPSTDDAKTWQGWGTALKPAWEPIIMARKPIEGTVAQNIQKYGTGAMNIDAGRIATDDNRTRPPRTPNEIYGGGKGTNLTSSESHPSGRWPANVILDEEAAAMLDKQSGESKSTGGASRFFYCAKVSRSEREIGCEDLDEKLRPMYNGAQIHAEEGYDKAQSIGLNRVVKMKNNHPTVKPIKLMSYLCKLVTQPNGTILDPFMGSGSTGLAAIPENFQFIGIEKEKEYLEIAKNRLLTVDKDLTVIE